MHYFGEFLNVSPLARAVFGGRTDLAASRAALSRRLSPTLDRVLRSIHRLTIYLIKVQLPLPQEDDYNRHWSVLRQTIRLINLMTIFRTLMELSSLTGHLKV